MAIQSSGHKIHASHIEFPDTEFIVAWKSPEYWNVLRFEDGVRWARVLAQTARGALTIAKYHHYRGYGFEILNEPPTIETTL